MTINRFKIRSLMTEAGLSNKGLSELSGLSPSAVSRIVKGRRPTPDMDSFYKLSNGLSKALGRKVFISELCYQQNRNPGSPLNKSELLILIQGIDLDTLESKGGVLGFGLVYPKVDLPKDESLLVWDDDILITSSQGLGWRQRIFTILDNDDVIHNRAGDYNGISEMPPKIITLDKNKNRSILELNLKNLTYSNIIYIKELKYGPLNPIDEI